jgi:HlyD family secretion protein
MQRRTLLTLAAGGAALLALLAWAFAPRPLPVETAAADLGTFELVLQEDAKTRLHERYVVSAPLAGRLARITLREGDAVAAGDALARLTPVMAPMQDERTLAEQRARVQITQVGVQRAATRSAAARIALEQVRTDLRRNEELARQGFVAPTRLEGQRLAVLSAEKELELAQEGERIAAHELTQARAALGAVGGSGTSAGATREFVVRAPVAGRVLRVAQPSEAVVALGTPLLELGDTRQLEVVAELLSTEALRAAPGSPVRIERWGGEGVLEGVVRRIEPAAFTKISALGVEEQRVRVHIDLTSPPERWAALGDGFALAVHIVLARHERVLRVPVSAVFPRPVADGGGPAVFVVDGGRARLQPVAVGGRNGQQAWVTEGLAEGQTVIVYPGAAVADGVRVKPREV